MALQAETMILAAANPSRSLVFFPASESSVNDTWLCYNYKTGQWTSVSAYGGERLYSLNDDNKDIGVIVYSSGAVDLQDQATSYPAQEANIETAYRNINQGGRARVDGVRPLVEDADAQVAVEWRDSRNPSTRTNLFTYSEDFGTSFTLNNITISTDAIAAPDGETTADQFQESASGDAERYGIDSISHTPGAIVCASVFAKQGTGVTFLGLQGDKAASNVLQWFDLENGRLGSVGTGDDDPLTAGMYDVGDDWYLCFITFESSGPTSNITFYQSDTDDTKSYTGAGSQGIYVWGKMAEEGVYFPSGYIKSDASSGTSEVHETLFRDVNSRTDMANFRQFKPEARYHRLKLKVTGGFTTIVGAEVEFNPAGRV